MLEYIELSNGREAWYEIKKQNEVISSALVSEKKDAKCHDSKESEREEKPRGIFSFLRKRKGEV